MYDRFTDDARDVMGKAREAAEQYHHDHIDPEHVLIGLTAQAEGTGTAVLQALEVDLDRLREKVASHLKPGHPSAAKTRMLPFTDRAKRILEAGQEAAQSLGHRHLGTEHLLLALVGEARGLATTALHSLGVDETKVRSAIR